MIRMAFSALWRLPAAALESLTVGMAFLLICFFASLFGWTVFQTWRAAPGNPPKYSDAFVYVTTALASLVGGIVAVAFGQPQALARSLDWLAILTIIYAAIYVVFGILALTTWIFRTRETSALLKTLATTFLGLAVPVVTAFFRNALRTSP